MKGDEEAKETVRAGSRTKKIRWFPVLLNFRGNRESMLGVSQSEDEAVSQADGGSREITDMVDLGSLFENDSGITSAAVQTKTMQESLMLALIIARAMDLSSASQLIMGKNKNSAEIVEEESDSKGQIDDPGSGSGSGTTTIVALQQQPLSNTLEVPQIAPVNQPPTTLEIVESSRGKGKSGRETVRLVTCWFSPFAHRVAISLREKGVQYVVIEESTLNKNDRTLYANPLSKRIPILMHKGRVISESRIIMEYIEEVWTEDHSALLPRDPFERSAARYWSDYIDKKITQILLQHIGVNVKEVYDSVSDALIGLNKAMTVISHGKLYFMGDRLGFVDIMFAPMIPWFQVLKKLDNYSIPDATMCPRLHEWLSALQKHPSVRPSLEDSSPKKLRAFVAQRFRESPK